MSSRFRRDGKTEARQSHASPSCFHHFDLYAQALAKLERGHHQDVLDVREMLQRSLVTPPQLLAYFERIEPDLYRYPAIDPPSFRRAVEAVVVEP